MIGGRSGRRRPPSGSPDRRSTCACWPPSAGTATTWRCMPTARTPRPGWAWPRPSPGRPGRPAGRRRRMTGAAADRQRLGLLRRPVRRAVPEMLDGGELDVLTGDYLAELTMLILARDRLDDPGLGYRQDLSATTGNHARAGAGPRGADRQQCRRPEPGRAGRRDRRAGRPARPEPADRLRRAATTSASQAAEHGLGRPLAANAYLGGWGIADCLAAGADIVVTGRVTDASLVLGPAAAHFGWGRQDFDQLAGAVVAGHVLECGTQATGGNYTLLHRDRRSAPARASRSPSCAATVPR